MNMLKALKADQISIKVFTALLFLSCASFVSFKTFQCFEKFLQYPIGAQISQVSSKEVPFPSITLCPHPQNKMKTNYYIPKMYNETFLQTCNLTVQDYVNGKWSKNVADEICSDPKAFHENLIPSIENLRILKIEIRTFNGDNMELHYNDRYI